MNGLILAAGTGSRLVDLTRDLPKALVTVAGRPLLDYVLTFAKHCECDQLYVVGGFYYDKLREHLTGTSSGHLEALENKAFLEGSILTLNCALPEIDGDLLVLNVDHIYPRKLARHFLQRRGDLEEVTAFVDCDRPLQEDDMKVELDTSQGRVARISKGLHDFDAGYIGLTYVPHGVLGRYREAAAKLAEDDRTAVVEDVLQALIGQGHNPSVLMTSEMRWLEVDNQWDLSNAERILRCVPGFLE